MQIRSCKCTRRWEICEINRLKYSHPATQCRLRNSTEFSISSLTQIATLKTFQVPYSFFHRINNMLFLKLHEKSRSSEDKGRQKMRRNYSTVLLHVCVLTVLYFIFADESYKSTIKILIVDCLESVFASVITYCANLSHKYSNSN